MISKKRLPGDYGNNWETIIEKIVADKNGGYLVEKRYELSDDDEVTTQEQWDAVMESEERDAAAWGSKPVMDRKAKQFEDFAKEAMHELAKAGIADFVLLKNDKLRTWWQQVLKEELAEQVKKDAIAHKKQLKEQALSKLSDEEKEALGLTKKEKR